MTRIAIAAVVLVLAGHAARGDQLPPIALPGLYHNMPIAEPKASQRDPRMPEPWPGATLRTQAARWLHAHGCATDISRIDSFAASLDLTVPEAILVLKALEREGLTTVDAGRRTTRLQDCR